MINKEVQRNERVDVSPYAPHETRMLALQIAVEFVNGDSRKGIHYTTEDVIDSAKKFEFYLTDQPIEGFEP